jgi:CHAD domain-containing protein
VAPLAATFAATMAVGVGVAVARAGRERLLERSRRRRRLGLGSQEPLGEGLRRMALEQLDLCVELLQSRNGTIDEHAVHETRKAIKRLRALVLLLRDQLGDEAAAREQDALRRTAARLSGARDSEVLLATLDGLVERHPRELGRPSVARLRDHLAAENARQERLTLGDPLLRAEALGELLAVRGRVPGWRMPAGGSLAPLEPALERIYRQGRVRYRRVTTGKRSRTRAMHEWRKRVKDLRYAAEMLQREPAATPATVLGRKRRRRGKTSQRLRRVERRADELGELLGEDHDLAVLAQLVRGRPPTGTAAPPAMAPRPRRRLLKLIKRRRARLRARALRGGARLYRRPPKAFVKRARVSFAAARPSSR